MMTTAPKKYVLKLKGGNAGAFLSQLNEVFGDRLLSSGIPSPAELEVECLAADIAQIRSYFAPQIASVDEARPGANDNFWPSFGLFY